MSRALPDVLMTKVDEYVDSLAPQIQPRIADELVTFQKKTLDNLEDRVVDAFRSLFNSDQAPQAGSRGLNSNVPDTYGGQSLPFADEISKLTRSFTDIAGGASDDLREIFDLTETRGGSNTRDIGGTRERGSGGGDGFKTFLSTAVNMVEGHINKGSGPGGQRFELDGLLGVISTTVKDAARNPEEKARMITPEIKEKLGVEMQKQHSSIAEQFTRIALDHIKRWLRGNTSTRDLGDGVKGEIEDQVKDLVKGLGGLFGSKKHHGGESARGFGDRDGGSGEEHSGGFSKLISEKLSTGLARVHREVRLEFRKILGEIERKLFELLPDQFQRPLEKLLGGNPFDSQLDRETGGGQARGFGGQGDRGFDDLKVKLLSKVRNLVKKVQEMLRESILGLVNGGHRKFERESWVFVQDMVEKKVQKYLPKVKINVPDDIGNEGVSVGAPTSNVQLGGGHQVPPQQPASQSGQGSRPSSQHQPSQSYAPPQQQNQQPYYPPPPQDHGSQQYAPPPQDNHSQQHHAPPSQEHGSQQYYPPPPPQELDSKPYYPPPPPQQHHSQQYNPQEYNPQQYNPQQYNPQEYGSQQGQGSQQSSQYGQNPPY